MPVPLMRQNQDRRPWGLIVALILAATAGVLSLPLQVATFRNLDAATGADIARNARLVEQVRLLEETGNADVREHRVRNEELHACIVDLALALANPRRDRTKPIPNPCPTPLTDPGR